MNVHLVGTHYDPYVGGTGPGDRLIAGAMSGTSADGVDVALVNVSGRGPSLSAKLLRHFHQPYPPDLRQAIFRIREAGSVELSALGRVGRELSLIYAKAVNEALATTGFRHPAFPSWPPSHGTGRRRGPAAPFVLYARYGGGPRPGRS